MTTQEIEILIEACKNAGVTKFKFEKLEIHFSDTPRQVLALAPNTLADRAIEREIEEDPDLRDLRLQNLMIENPLEYEAAMRMGDGSYDQ